jgi:polyisoprenoid-binding protein YceI
VSKPVVVPVTMLGVARDPWGAEKLGIEAEFVLNRKDFGLNWNAVVETGGFVVGDEIKVSLSVQGKAE